jgi:tetratricopeptide (TPR) repeat protein
MMTAGLYVKANGELPCWDDVGEDRILRVLDPKRLAAGEEADLFRFPGLQEIRRAFLEGRDPHPDLCPRCAVRGHGRLAGLTPTVIDVLHVEPSFLCHLACPQCVPPKRRRKVKHPPYNMPVPFYEALLRSLAQQGIEAIRLVLFEGRGDPLMNSRLGELAALTKCWFPGSYTIATTHGCYPYRPWMTEGHLDCLRLAIDGAFPESYGRYRVGGDIQRAFALMERLRDEARSRGSRLRVEWKYILFEWNDSDAEIREAARLAERFSARLRFCLTHSEGRSPRFRDEEELHQALKRLAPYAAAELTFQLKGRGAAADVDQVLGEHAAGLLAEALRLTRAGRRREADECIRRALQHDPGIPAGPEPPGEDPIRRHIGRIRSELKFPATASGLANILLARREIGSALELFRLYLTLAPDAPDRAEVRTTIRRIRKALLVRPLKRMLGR